MIFFKKKENLLPTVKDIIKNFLEEENLSWLDMGLHHIEIKDKTKLFIHIYLFNPSPLIGRRGRRIIALASRISKGLDRVANVYAHEWNIWE